MKPKWLFMVAVASVLAALAIIGGSALAQGPVPQNGTTPPTATPVVVADQPVVNGAAPQAPTGGGGPGPVSTYFSYQGQLKSGNTLVNGYCDFVFSLWDQSGTGQPPSGGIQIGTTLTQTNLSVANGLFNSTLSFGTTAFNGEARWLQIAVRCPAGSAQAYTILSPRQALWATPYALSLRPGTAVEGSQSNWNVIYASNIATANLSYGIRALSDSPLGRGVSGESGATGGMGVYGFSVSSGGAGVAGYIGSNDIDIDTFDTQQYGVFGKSASNTGIGVMSLSGSALVTDTHPSDL